MSKSDSFKNLNNSSILTHDLNPACGGILWSKLNSDAPIRIIQTLLSEFLAVQKALIENHSKTNSPSYHVLSSDIPAVFSLGGDLEYFCQCAKQHNREGLIKYAHDSVDWVYKTASNYNLPITTIALVKGAALGGGFEAALSANYVIAEEQATFAFPETRFGLFPGMGAFTFLRQRVTTHIAEEMIYSGRQYTAKELFHMNVIDQLCKTGEGEACTLKFIKSRHQRHQGIYAMRQMVQQHSPIDKQELITIVEHWVDCVLKLNAKQIRLIETLSKTTLQSSEATKIL